MAERRMFAKSIVNSGRFLKMPPTTRLLYYDLGMMADDDGIVEAYSVMTQTKATEDDLRVLVAKGYIKVLNDDLVSAICDWKTNNFIRSDRYHPSIYAELIYEPDNGIPDDNQLTTNGIPDDNQRYTEVRLGEDRIGKDRKGKERDGDGKPPKTSNRFIKPSPEEIKAYCLERHNGIDAERFFDYYEANGWVQSKGKPIKDWKAAVRTWERNQYNSNQTEQRAELPDMYRVVSEENNDIGGKTKYYADGYIRKFDRYGNLHDEIKPE